MLQLIEIIINSFCSLADGGRLLCSSSCSKRAPLITIIRVTSTLSDLLPKRVQAAILIAFDTCKVTRLPTALRGQDRRQHDLTASVTLAWF
jgi:hypothetical protein